MMKHAHACLGLMALVAGAAITPAAAADQHVVLYSANDDTVNRIVAEGFKKEEIDNLQMYDAVGCSGCNEGYKGRVGIYQVMPMTEEIAKIILSGGGAIQIAYAAHEMGIPDLRQSAMKKVRDGLTSLAEINRVTKD